MDETNQWKLSRSLNIREAPPRKDRKSILKIVFEDCKLVGMATGNYVEVEADRKAAEDSGCAVNLKSNQQSPADHAEIQSEAPKSSEEDVGRRRGQGHSWGRGRPRASRFRPGHYGQGSLRDNHATESDMLEDKDSEKRLSPSYTGHEKHLPSGDWDTGPPSYSSASHSLESQSRPQPQSRDIGFVEKSSAVSSEIPASVKENT